tara:strand:+ start:28 stop:234 length:207 start_codon:yes stop_codon:yes gene_type:complete
MEDNLKEQLEDLRSRYVSLSIILDELWGYHPSNPNFVNIIRAHSEVVDSLTEIEGEINVLEYKINSLN